MRKPTVILLIYLMTFSGEKLAFVAASVKRNTSGQRGYALPPPIGDRFVATNVSLKMLVSYAYHLQDHSTTNIQQVHYCHNNASLSALC